MIKTETTVEETNPYLIPDPIASTFNIPAAFVNCKNCINHSDLVDFDDELLWCHGWRQEVNTTDFCSFFKPIP